ncbi:alpha/beta fold hydrolase [Variovorax sp. LjRoot290]|uniref:alpha/beta fold hydrolase n=1 Tax=unclassified Variovorax TaxID=663243 RepID=UPI003ECC824E
MTTREETQQRIRPPADADAREQLLAGLPVTQRQLRLAGVSTAMLEGGDGPSMVLLHGPGGNAAHWLQVIPDLARTHRVVAPDLPGQGASEVDEGPLDADRVFAWLGELIARTCPSPPVLVGYALGGAIAARFASQHGDRLDRLVLVDTLGLSPFQPAQVFGLALNDFIAQPTEHTHDRLWQYCALDLDDVRQRMGELLEPFKAYNLDRARTPGVQAALGALMDLFGLPAIPSADLARIAVPTTLIWGRYDRVTGLPVAEASSARYGWPLHVIEDADDDPAIEQPEAFVRAVRAALADSLNTPESTRDAWDRIAKGYDRTNTPTQMWVGNEGLRRAGVLAGMSFLDVAAGSGALSIPAARFGAQVLATDQSPAMLEHLDARARKEGLAIETRVMDGHALALEDSSFDVAGSQFGVMLFPDMPRGIREMARVVKPTGRVLMTVYGDPHEIEFFGFFVAAIRSVVPSFEGPTMDPLPLPFQLKDPERLRQELTKAGLQQVSVETVTEKTAFESGEHMWDWLVHSNPIVGEVLGHLHLTQDQLVGVQQTLDDMVRERAVGAGPAVLTAPIHIGVGTKSFDSTTVETN